MGLEVDYVGNIHQIEDLQKDVCEKGDNMTLITIFLFCFFSLLLRLHSLVC